MPMTSVRSLPSTPSTNQRPSPGTANTFSTTKLPVKAKAVAGPSQLSTGSMAFFRAWSRAARARESPLARAVRTWSLDICSIMPTRTRRATVAAKGSESATAGSTSGPTPPQPPTGNHLSRAANRMSSPAPITKLGRLMPTMASSWTKASIQRRGWRPLNVPANTPMTIASSMAAAPSVTLTGRAPRRISFTPRSGCRRLGPRSNGRSARPSTQLTPEALPRYSR